MSLKDDALNIDEPVTDKVAAIIFQGYANILLDPDIENNCRGCGKTFISEKAARGHEPHCEDYKEGDKA